MSVNYSTFRSNALNFVYSIIIIMIFSCRVISRVVLIPFCDNDEDTEDTLAPSSRELADRNLQQCIKEAYKAAGVMVSVGKSLCTSQAQLHQVMASSLEGASQRIYVSYAWLLLAVLKVRLINYYGLC